MYMIRGAVGEKTQYIVELTGEGPGMRVETPQRGVVVAR